MARGSVRSIKNHSIYRPHGSKRVSRRNIYRYVDQMKMMGGQGDVSETPPSVNRMDGEGNPISDEEIKVESPEEKGLISGTMGAISNSFENQAKEVKEDLGYTPENTFCNSGCPF